MGQRRILWVGGGALLLVAAIYGVLDHERGSAKRESPPRVSTRSERPDKGKILDSRIRKSEDGEKLTERQKLVEDLKKKFADLKPRGNGAVKELKALAQESAALLGCSEEAIALLVWLNQNGQGYAQLNMRLTLERGLKSPMGGALRAQLTKLPGHASRISRDGQYEVQRLCHPAGETCPPEEFDAFYRALQNEGYAQEAMLGRNLSLMGTDPVAGILSTLEILEGDVHTLTKGDHLNRQMRGPFPEGVDYAELERLLPASTDPMPESVLDWGPVDSGRQQFMGTWAAVDREAATTYVLANLDRVPMRTIRTIGVDAKFRSLEEALGWVEDFEEGAAFDHAAWGAIYYLRAESAETAIGVAERIADPQIRAEALEHAKKATLR